MELIPTYIILYIYWLIFISY